MAKSAKHARPAVVTEIPHHSVLAGPVDDDPGPAAGAAAGNEDVDRRDVAIDQLPKQRRTEVAEDGLRAGGENGGHPATVPRQVAMADGVDTVVDLMQPAADDEPGDVRRRHPQRKDLGARDDAMLAGRHPR